MRDIVFVNGRYVARDEATVNVEDRGYQFADGVYEVVRFRGRRSLRLTPHLDRLQRSCEELRIKGAPSNDEWLSIIDHLLDECEISENDDQNRTLYQQITRGVCARNHVFPKTPCTPAVVAYFRPAPVYTAEQRNQGIKLSVQPDERWERCHIKSICLLPVVLAKQAAIEAGAFEALLVRDGIVTEGGATNAFCVRDGVVWTHPEGKYILSGVTRGLVLEAAERAGVRVREEAVTLEEFLAAEETFISSTTMDIMPVTKIDDLVIADGRVGPVTRRLMETANDMVAQELGSIMTAGK